MLHTFCFCIFWANIKCIYIYICILHFLQQVPVGSVTEHTKHDIAYTLARRICAIVKKESIREKQFKELEVFLQKQNYPKGIIKKGIEKAERLTVTDLRSTKQKLEINKTLPLVITRNPNNPRIVGMVKDSLKFLSNSPEMKNLLEEVKK